MRASSLRGAGGRLGFPRGGTDRVDGRRTRRNNSIHPRQYGVLSNGDGWLSVTADHVINDFWWLECRVADVQGSDDPELGGASFPQWRFCALPGAGSTSPMTGTHHCASSEGIGQSGRRWGCLPLRRLARSRLSTQEAGAGRRSNGAQPPMHAPAGRNFRKARHRGGTGVTRPHPEWPSRSQRLFKTATCSRGGLNRRAR